MTRAGNLPAHWIAVLLALLVSIPTEGNEPSAAVEPGQVASKSPAKSTRHALVLCGHPGDRPHRQAFLKTVNKLYEALTGPLGFPQQNVRVLFGGETTMSDGAAFGFPDPLQHARPSKRRSPPYGPPSGRKILFG